MQRFKYFSCQLASLSINWKNKNFTTMKKTTVSFLFLFILIFTECHKIQKCESPRNVNQSSINVTFKDQITGKYLYTENNSLYNKDSIKIFDPEGNSLFLLFSQNQLNGTPTAFWVINFGNIYDQQTDANSFNTEICKNYIVKYYYNESDTLHVCFKSKKTGCGSVFETLKIYQREKLLDSVENTTDTEITIIKN